MASALDWKNVWENVMSALAVAALSGVAILTWRRVGGSAWAKRLEEHHLPSPCPRCSTKVPAWFIDETTPLPENKADDLSGRVDRLRRERGLSPSDAMIEASTEAGANRDKPSPETFGCWVCAGKAKQYPRPSESRRAFLRRTTEG